MRIAGVSVKKGSKVSKETLIDLALTTQKYAYMKRKEALKLINKEINDSGLFKTYKPKVRKSNKKSTKDNRGTDNNKQS